MEEGAATRGREGTSRVDRRESNAISFSAGQSGPISKFVSARKLWAGV